MEKVMKKAFGFNTYYEVWCKDEELADKRHEKVLEIFSNYENSRKFSCQKSMAKFYDGPRYCLAIDAPGSVWKDIIEALEIRKIDSLNWC